MEDETVTKEKIQGKREKSESVERREECHNEVKIMKRKERKRKWKRKRRRC